MKILQALLASLLSFAVCAEEPSLYCRSANTPITRVYYVNGVWNTEPAAVMSSLLIREAYIQRLTEEYPDQAFEFHVAYNYSFGKVQDLVEVIAQKRMELGLAPDDLTPRQYLALYMTARKVHGEGEHEEYMAVYSSWGVEIPVVIENYLVSQYTASVNAEEMISKFRNDLFEGARVLLFAHSQGNMYATIALLALMDEYAASINMIGIASPAAVVYNDSPYFTARDDRVINTLRRGYDVLPANVDNDPGVFGDRRDVANHQFAPSYFEEGLASRPLIDVAFFNSIASSQFPAPIVNTGIITAALTWGEEPDVDLHVYEPNGFHVYYRAFDGISGYLDLDDTSSYGPEHYYVSCETLEVGTYSIGVNYYYGTAPEMALVQISAGSSVRTFLVSLAESVGDSGDDTPVPVADIIVTGSADEGYAFSIEARMQAVDGGDGDTSNSDSVCGNNICETGETLLNCSADCYNISEQ